jgi:hypothetical protein
MGNERGESKHTVFETRLNIGGMAYRRKCSIDMENEQEDPLVFPLLDIFFFFFQSLPSSFRLR